MITGISDDLSLDKSNKLLNSVLESRYGMEYKEARTLGRYHNLYKLLKQRINIASKLNDLMTKIYSNESKFLPYIYSRYSIYIGIDLSWVVAGFRPGYCPNGGSILFLPLFLSFRSRKRWKIRKRNTQVPRSAKGYK